MSNTMSKFKMDLEYSLAEGESRLLNRFYHRIFSNIDRIEFVNSLEQQKKGIDKIIHLKDGSSFTLDEKKRRVDYGDILLELWSVYEKRKQGWLFTSQCDYIVYVVIPTNKVYLLPVVLLKKAWRTNYSSWITKYRYVYAKNEGYTTKSIAIPKEILLQAISNEMSQQFFEDKEIR